MSEKQMNPKNIQEDKVGGYYSNRPKFVNRGPSKIRQQFGRGMTAFLVVAASIAFYFALLRFPDLSDGIATIVRVSQPIIYGLVIAYLLNPLVKKVDKYLIPALEKKFENPKKAHGLSRACGIVISLVAMAALISALCNMLIPELYRSIRDLVIDLPGQVQHMITLINQLEVENGAIRKFLQTAIEEATTMFENWVRNDLFGQINDIMSGLTVGVVNFLGTILDLVVGIIVSIYVLINKDTFSCQAKKVVYAVLPAHRANILLHITKKSNEIFGGFIIGKIIDSAIIGVLCFIGVSLLKMPYATLVSVIVGVTNVIPYFGPFIGAIPSAILILLVDPMKGLYFIIFIFLLQQLDGNYIGPTILGSSTGLSSFWVIFAIMIGGGLFGFMGMLLGVPTFALILYLTKLWLNYRLEKKNLPTQSELYDELSYVDDEGNYVHSAEHIAAREMVAAVKEKSAAGKAEEDTVLETEENEEEKGE